MYTSVYNLHVCGCLLFALIMHGVSFLVLGVKAVKADASKLYNVSNIKVPH